VSETTIQRVPRALLEVLGSYGGEGPKIFGEQVVGMIDLLQFYGKSGRQVFSANNAAAAEGTLVTLTVPPNQHWVFFSGFARAVKTATVTALEVAFYLEGQVVAARAMFPYGATETGQVDVPFFAPYPVVLIPGATISVAANIIGTDANVNLSVQVLVGVLG